MPECKECGKNIHKLKNIQECLMEWDFKVNKKNPVGCYSKKPSFVDTIVGSESTWNCPDCNSILFYDEQDAVDFLNGLKRVLIDG